MNPRLVAAIVLGLAISGCIAPPRGPAVQATWYLRESVQGNNTNLFVALLNRSPEVQTISGLGLNSLTGRIEDAWTNKHFKVTVLRPGQVLVQRIDDFKRFAQDGAEHAWPRCQLPTELIVVFGEKKNAETQLSFGGQIPDSLPTGWDQCVDGATGP